jgi:hypothetical protein
VLEIAEGTGHIKSGGKNDARFIADLFLKHMAKIARQSMTDSIVQDT